MTAVNPVQATTYYLSSGNNPITFGTVTGIDVSSGSGIGVSGSNVQSWAVTNKGAISGTIYGVDLTSGSSVTNKAGAAISGGYGIYNSSTYSANLYGSGISILGGSGTVINGGTISSHSWGVKLGAGGSVANQAGATINGGYGRSFYGYFFGLAGGCVNIFGSAGTVTNAGTISSDGSYGVELAAGGSVTNEAGATITGRYGSAGIDIAGGAGTVTNAGDISGFSFGVELRAGGSVTNKAGGTISGEVYLVAGGSVTNETGATISGGRGIELYAGGSITNKAGGAIYGYVSGVRTFGAMTLTNAGAITAHTTGIGGNAVAVYAAGSVVNKAGATIIGGYGVYFGHNSAGTVTNAGNITGYISQGGNLLFASGAVLATGESLNNQSTGTISGYHAGVWLFKGGSVTNYAGGTISGHDIGILTGILSPQGGPTTVTNAGAITGEGGVVAIGSAATVTNSGTITGTTVGSVTFGTVQTLGDGVFMNAGGTVANNVSGTVTGAGDGVYLAGGGAVTNAGTISGATASVQFAGAGANTLTLETGSMLNGDAIGSTANGATNTLALEGAGRADNNFLDFNTLTVGGDWTLGGTSSFDGATISSGASLDDVGALTLTGTSALGGSKIIISGNDTFTMDGTTALSGKVLGAGTLAFTGGNATLNNGASLSVAGWTISGSGTSVTLDENLSYAGAFSEGAGVTFVLSGGHLLLNGADTFAGGTVDGSNVLDTKGTTTLSGLTIGGTVEWENEGTVTQSGGSATIGDAGGDTAFLDNRSGGIYDITDDSGIGLGSSTASNIQNAGLLEKTSGTGTSAIAPAVTNTGTIEVTAGTLDLQGAVTGKGSDEVSGASTLEFDFAVAATQTVNFLGGPSAVDLIDPNAFLGRIADFASSNTVHLSGDWVFSGFSENAAGTLGTLTLASGASRHAFDFVGDYTASDFKITSGSTTTIGHT